MTSQRATTLQRPIHLGRWRFAGNHSGRAIRTNTLRRDVQQQRRIRSQRGLHAAFHERNRSTGDHHINTLKTRLDRWCFPSARDVPFGVDSSLQGGAICVGRHFGRCQQFVQSGRIQLPLQHVARSANATRPIHVVATQFRLPAALDSHRITCVGQRIKQTHVELASKRLACPATFNQLRLHR